MERMYKLENNFRIKADVYGKTRDGKIFIVEVGEINGEHPEKKLEKLLEHHKNGDITFIYIENFTDLTIPQITVKDYETEFNRIWREQYFEKIRNKIKKREYDKKRSKLT